LERAAAEAAVQAEEAERLQNEAAAARAAAGARSSGEGQGAQEATPGERRGASDLEGKGKGVPPGKKSKTGGGET